MVRKEEVVGLGGNDMPGKTRGCPAEGSCFIAVIETLEGFDGWEGFLAALRRTSPEEQAKRHNVISIGSYMRRSTFTLIMRRSTFSPSEWNDRTDFNGWM